MKNARPETLSEHTLEVCFIAHMLAAIGNSRLGKNLSPEKAVMFALYHDVGEIITGDMPTPIKHGDEALKRAYKKIEDEAEKKIFSLLPDDLRAFYAISVDAEHNKLVKAADKISALIKCIDEEKSGNLEFRSAKETTMTLIKALGSEEADIFLDEFLNGFYKDLDELL